MLNGYTNQISLSAGEDLQLHVSTNRPAFTIDVVRLLHGDPNPAGPGYQEEKLDWVPRGPYPGQVQPVCLGSYGTLPPPPEALEAFTFACWVCPTAPDPCNQVIWSWGNSIAFRIELGIDEHWHLIARIFFENDRETRSIQVSGRLFAWRWQFVGVGVDFARGEFNVFAGQRGAFGPVASRAQIPVRTPLRFDLPMLLAASNHEGRPHPAFNGKLGHPVLLARCLDDIDLCQLQAGVAPGLEASRLGEWDLSRDVGSDRVVDISGHEGHGKLYNAPARTVTGHSWTGPRDKRYTDAPSEYDAVHFHDDDLSDAGWQPSAMIRIPPEARPGIYAARLEAPGDAPHWLTFVVNKKAQGSAHILFVVPTLTWQAYGNQGRPDDERRYGPSLYATHNDGTSPYYISLRKPISTLEPTSYYPPHEPSKPPTLRCSHLVMTDLYTIHWLEHLGVAYDVISDHEFDRLGAEALLPHRLVLLGGHHEYWTQRMLDGLETYLSREQSRLMCLSGNSLYWVSSIDPVSRHVMEVRRGGGTSTSDVEPGESQHSTTLVPGGTWRSVGRAPQRLVGVGFAATGVAENGSGFRRLEASGDPRVAFIFAGITQDEIIGDFGLNQGAAAGFEVDRADPALGEADEVLLLASTCTLASSFVGTNEDGLGRAPQDTRVRGDIVYMKKPSGAEVFSAGSITWTGSLSHHGFDNNVARMSTNVLREFLKAEASRPAKLAG